MRYFFDNTFPRQLVKFISKMAEKDPEPYEVIHLKDKFRADTPDIDWITALGDEGDWVIITADKAQLRRKAESQAIKSSGLSVFFIFGQFTNRNRWDQSWMLLKSWLPVVENATKRPTMQAFKINQHQQVQKINM